MASRRKMVIPPMPTANAPNVPLSAPKPSKLYEHLNTNKPGHFLISPPSKNFGFTLPKFGKLHMGLVNPSVAIGGSKRKTRRHRKQKTRRHRKN